jgi:hypothetical protein
LVEERCAFFSSKIVQRQFHILLSRAGLETDFISRSGVHVSARRAKFWRVSGFLAPWARAEQRAARGIDVDRQACEPLLTLPSNDFASQERP